MVRRLGKFACAGSAPAPRAAAFGMFCALLGLGVVKGSAVGPAPAAASDSISTPAPAASHPDGPDVSDGRHARAAALVEVINGHVVLWKLQHGGKLPDFDAYPDWQQFLQATDRAGWPSGDTRTGGEFAIRPYLTELPINPFNGLGNVATVRTDLHPGDELPDGRRAGFVMRVPGGEVFATGAGGNRIVASGEK